MGDSVCQYADVFSEVLCLVKDLCWFVLSVVRDGSALTGRPFPR